jgi:nitroreductase
VTADEAETPPWASNETLATIATARAVRRFQDEPVTREQLRSLIQAATCAPNPRNLQPWEFVVITDPDRRARIAAAIEPRAAEVEAAIPRLRSEARRKVYRAGAALMRSLGSAPALVLVCGHQRDYGPDFDDREILLSALHAASQNLLLAARSLGLGGAFTTLHLHAEAECRDVAGLPDDLVIAATIPIGVPAGTTGPVRRRAVDEVLHFDRYELPTEG